MDSKRYQLYLAHPSTAPITRMAVGADGLVAFGRSSLPVEFTDCDEAASFRAKYNLKDCKIREAPMSLEQAKKVLTATPVWNISRTDWQNAHAIWGDNEVRYWVAGHVVMEATYTMLGIPANHPIHLVECSNVNLSLRCNSLFFRQGKISHMDFYMRPMKDDLSVIAPKKEGMCEESGRYNKDGVLEAHPSFQSKEATGPATIGGIDCDPYFHTGSHSELALPAHLQQILGKLAQWTRSESLTYWFRYGHHTLHIRLENPPDAAAEPILFLGIIAELVREAEIALGQRQATDTYVAHLADEQTHRSFCADADERLFDGSCDI